jgi:electron transfer flavoprotein alpha/beta subunit
VCLHGASVVGSSLPLYPTDRRAIMLGLAIGAEVIVVEAVGQRGIAPVAVSESLIAGAKRAVRLVESALASSDAHTTGLVFASILDHLEVDLILCGSDADPEGIGDVPAHIALHMASLYLADVVDLTPINGDVVGATVSCGSWIHQLEVPLNAVLPVAAWRESKPTASASYPANPGGIEIVTLRDLGIDQAIVRKRNPLRGVVEFVTRPLITLRSAAGVGELLRRS